MSIDTNRNFSKTTKQKGSSVDPDETARYEPSHLDLHCLHRYLFWSDGLKGLTLGTLWANSEEANRSGSAQFAMKYLNLYQKSGSSNLIS